MKKILIFTLAIALTTACGTEQTAENSDHSEEVKSNLLNVHSVKVNWTAFKHSDKKPVKGTFDDVKLTGVEPSEDLHALMAGVSVEIATSSINSGNPDRDGKISRSFFGNLLQGAGIKGKITSFNGTTGMFLMTMNGVEKELSFNYVFENDTLKMFGDLSIPDFEAVKALDSIHSVCSELHKGEDGESLLWPDVAFEIVAVIK